MFNHHLSVIIKNMSFWIWHYSRFCQFTMANSSYTSCKHWKWITLCYLHFAAKQRQDNFVILLKVVFLNLIQVHHKYSRWCVRSKLFINMHNVHQVIGKHYRIYWDALFLRITQKQSILNSFDNECILLSVYAFPTTKQIKTKTHKPLSRNVGFFH